MSGKSAAWLVAAAALSTAGTGNAYEIDTHARITSDAYLASVLSTDKAALEARLGIDLWTFNTNPAPFRVGAGDLQFEFNVATGVVSTFKAGSYELKRMSGSTPNPDALRIVGWMMRGAVREDDGGLVAAIKKGEAFQDYQDAYNRYCNHFYDPVVTRPEYGRAFTGFCFLEGRLDAVQHGMGSLDPFGSQSENTTRRNHFSILDAREAMWRALTLKDRAGAPVPRLSYKGEEVRKMYWATMFRILGDAVHLVQDMAQPQHTRNESHWPTNMGYEEFVNALMRGENSWTIDGLTLQANLGQLPPLQTAGYAPVRFDKYTDYYSTAAANGLAGGKGLADYSNRSFFTITNNFGNTATYQLPTSDISAYEVQPAPANALPYGGAEFRYYYANVRDAVTNGQDRVSMTTEGLFTDAIAQTAPSMYRLYALNRVNYVDRANVLLRRAVGYSAGLLNYYFRGTMEISLPDEGVYAVVDHAIASGNDKLTGGFRKVKLKVKNTSVDSTGARELMYPEGQLVAIARFHRNNCYESDLSGEYGAPGKSVQACRNAEEEIVVSEPVPAPADINTTASQVSFAFSTPVPISATDLFLQVAYRGRLGNERDAVVVQTKDISEPTYAYNFFIWDQFKYLPYPFLDPGIATFAEWCMQGFGALQPCYEAMGGTRKYQLAKDMSPILNWDPATNTIPQGTWTDIAQEPPMSHLFRSVTPALSFTRVAVLLDAVPTNRILLVEESIDDFHGRGQFQWSTGQVSGAIINQFDPQLGRQSTPITYVGGRGIFVPEVERPRLEGHAPGIDLGTLPNFTVIPSQINF